jgi:hypothetical protein
VFRSRQFDPPHEARYHETRDSEDDKPEQGESKHHGAHPMPGGTRSVAKQRSYASLLGQLLRALALNWGDLGAAREGELHHPLDQGLAV